MIRSSTSLWLRRSQRSIVVVSVALNNPLEDNPMSLVVELMAYITFLLLYVISFPRCHHWSQLFFSEILGTKSLPLLPLVLSVPISTTNIAVYVQLYKWHRFLQIRCCSLLDLSSVTTTSLFL